MERNDTGRQLREAVKVLPHSPGIYQFIDAAGKVIYVGKAKDLKKRVSSYFTKDKGVPGKVRVMVAKIRDIQTMVVATEADALLLENNLIKKYQPRYNIMWKDDKSFPWICIRNERFPRVFPTRNLIDDGSEYYGPYANVKMMNALLDLIRQLYPLRTCKHRLSETNIEQGKFRVCLEYHIGNCLAPCIGEQEEKDYLETLAQVRHIIKGNLSTAMASLKELMEAYASDFAFEKAQLVKEKLDLLQHFQARSTVVNTSIDHVDVVSLVDTMEEAYVNYIKVIRGAIVQTHTLEMKKKLDESPAEILSLAVTELRERFSSDAPEILVPFDPGIALPGSVFRVPKRGDRKHLLDLSERNARLYMLEKQKKAELVDPDRHANRIMERMKEDLRLPQEPRYIECFDNSNIQGTTPVAAMVVFRDGKPSKSEYRHFNIRDIVGPDDFASMAQVIERRYRRLLDEGATLPDLIVVDGGKGQLSAAVGSLDRLGIRGRMGIIGIAKRLEEIYYPGDSLPMYLDKRSETLRVLQHARDEAHRFGITFHRQKRDKTVRGTELTSIPGVGERTASDLLRKFRSVKRVREASIDELAACVGQDKAARVRAFFDGKAGR